MAAQFYKINYKSDFVLTINSDAGWAVPFCIKFWTGMPSHGYFAGFDGENYVNCRVGETPTQLLVMFDDHHMPVGPLRMQIAYHTTIEEFPDRKFDEVTNPTNVTVDIDGTEYQVMLDFTGETGAEIDFSMPSSGVMSVNGKIGYVTLNAEDVGAQPTIEDLATIRSGAAAGATAVQPAEMTAVLATKQDTISDLATIRNGAAAGATAVQPATLQEGLATKQDTISDLATIRSGAAAGATAVQPAALQEGLATKQDVISDLSTIRSGAAAGATAVQPAALTPIESDIDAIEGKIPSAASTSNQLADKAFVNSALAGKADTSDIPTALSQLSQDSTHRVVTDAEKSTWNGKQNAISDLATIRSGAAAGATAVQPAAMNTALAAKQDTLTFDNAPTANSNNPVKSSGIKTALDAKQSTISTVNVTVDNNTGTPSGSASVSGSTLSLSFQNLKGATGATGATGPQGPQGERGLPGESGVTGDVSGFTVIQTIDPSATYGATDIAGAAALQAANAELTELAGKTPEIDSQSVSDLDITDDSGFTLARFSEGHVKTKNFDSSKVNMEIVNGTYEASDLDVADDNGNVLVKFIGGHVKTKNFDSSKLAKGETTTFYENFLVDVDKGVEDNDGTSNDLQDTKDVQKDRCIINLPTNYSATGEPVRLIIANFGSAGRIQSNTTKAYHTMPLVDTMLAEGYAVMQVNGTPGETNGIPTFGGMGTPQFLRSVVKAYEYVINKYNIKNDGVFLSGWSQGTLKSWQIAANLQGTIPVKAAVLFGPCLDLWKLMYAYTPRTNREWMCEQFGFVEKVANEYVLDIFSNIYSQGDIVTKPTTYSAEKTLPNDYEFAYILNNYETWLGYDPICWGTSKNIIGEQFRYRSWVNTPNPNEALCFQDVSNIVPCPMKLFTGTADIYTTPKVVNWYKTMAENGGMECHFRWYQGGDHSYPTSYQTIQVQSKYGGIITTNVPSWEGILFLERYE